MLNFYSKNLETENLGESGAQPKPGRKLKEFLSRRSQSALEYFSNIIARPERLTGSMGKRTRCFSAVPLQYDSVQCMNMLELVSQLFPLKSYKNSNENVLD